MRLLARMLLFSALVCLPFVLLAVGQRRRDGLMWLIFPFLWGIPLALVALVVFAPLERALDGRGLGQWKDAGVPLAGGALAVGVLALVSRGAARSRNPRVRQRALRHRGRRVLYVAAGAVPGAAAGGLWRLTDWAATALKIAEAP